MLPAISIGLLSTGVLNLNNMRDIKNDLISGKNTFASSLGLEKAKIYHTIIVIGALFSSVIFTVLNFTSVWNFIYLISFPLFIIQLIQIQNTEDQQLLDPFLKRLALCTFAFSVLFGIGLML